MSIDQLLEQARRQIERLSPADAHRAAAGGAIIVDLRCQEDRLSNGAIPGSVHVPRTVLEWRADPDSPWRLDAIAHLDAHLILVCNDGYSSSLAAANLKRLGFERVADIAGGFGAWREHDLPVEEVPAAGG